MKCVGFAVSSWSWLGDVRWQVVLVEVVVYHMLLLLFESVVSAADDVLLGDGLLCQLEAVLLCVLGFLVLIAACVVAGIEHLILLVSIAGHAHYVPLLV